MPVRPIESFSCFLDVDCGVGEHSLFWTIYEKKKKKNMEHGALITVLMLPIGSEHPMHIHTDKKCRFNDTEELLVI
jgi:hypothetical protein